MTNKAVTLFYAYAHEDTALCAQLNEHLAALQQQGFIEAWSDQDIKAGDVYAEEIDQRMQAAQIILLLVSPSSLASNDWLEDNDKT